MKDRKEYNREYQKKNKKHLNRQKIEYIKKHPQQRKETTKYYRQKIKTSKIHVIKQLVRTARTNAKRKNLDFEINYQLITDLVDKQNSKCALTAFDFQYTNSKEYRSQPFLPSIDRINSKKGYTLFNTQMVCNMVNKAKNEYIQELFDQMCEARMKVLNG